jgi:hypothetical protein
MKSIQLGQSGLARVAGFLYLILAVTAAYPQMYVRPAVRVAGDATATARNIAINAELFRTAFAIDLVGIVSFVLVALVLYALLKSVDSTPALAMVAFVSVGAAVMAVNMLNHAAALLFATHAVYPAALGPQAGDGLAMLALDLHAIGVLTAQIFFGLWLLPLGYLVYRSGGFPRVLGVSLMAGCFFYLAGLLVAFLVPGPGRDLAPMVSMPAGIAELLFAGWLFFRGMKVREREVTAADRR